MAVSLGLARAIRLSIPCCAGLNLRGLGGWSARLLVAVAAAICIGQPAVAQGPAAEPGSVVIQVSGADAMYGFSSLTLPLNINLAGLDGFAESQPIALPAGQYGVAADDLSGIGVTFAGVACSDDDSSGSGVTRTAEIVLSPGERLVCLFSARSSATRAGELISEFTDNRGDLLMASLPNSQDRVDRLRGSVGVINSPKPFMESLPRIAAGEPIPVSVSLAALDRMAGVRQPNDFNLWLEGTFALLVDQGPKGRFGVVALGLDYRVTDALLIGTFAQFDTMTRQWSSDTSSMATLGWTAGGYATARIADSLYLDFLGGGGSSVNAIGPFGATTDRFDAASWLLSASLLGKWELRNWTFSPRVQVNYIDQTTQPYIDSAGNAVPQSQQGSGQIAIGPGISYRLTTESKLRVTTGIRFDTTTDILGAGELGNLRGRLEGKVEVKLPAGAKFGTTLGYGGIGSSSRVFTARGTLSLPLR